MMTRVLASAKRSHTAPEHDIVAADADAAARGADASPTRDQCEAMFVEHLPMIRRLLTSIARQRRFSPDDAEEFAAEALLRIIQDDYGVLRAFRGRCSLRTYLNVVCQRMCLDYRVAQWGKWRHSAAGRHGGDVAVLLERLTIRDGLTFDEACAVLTINHGVTVETDALMRLHAAFSVRARPRIVGEDELPDLPCPADGADRAVLYGIKVEALRSALDLLAVAVRELQPNEQLLLRLRFVDGMSVACIARLLQLKQKTLYRTFDRLLLRLRRRIDDPAVDGPQVLAALGTVDLEETQVFLPDACADRCLAMK